MGRLLQVALALLIAETLAAIFARHRVLVFVGPFAAARDASRFQGDLV